MIIRPLGFRFKNLYKYESTKHTSYNYARDGLLNKILPKYIMETKNRFTRALLDYIEYQAIWLFKYIDQLKYFKSPTKPL